VLVSMLPSPKPKVEDALEPGAPEVYKPPKPVKLNARARRQVDATIDAFVRSAVLRRDLSRSWTLASPSLRIGITRAQWMRGDIPVYPYPADPKRTAWELDYADEFEVALNVTLVPRARASEAPEVFGVTLEPVGRGASRHWLVGSWYPRGSVSQPQAAPSGTTSAQPAPSPDESEALRRATEGQIDQIWWLVPAGVLALIVLGPLLYFAVLRVRGGLRRRAS
jgi:hypothetical protein